MEALTCSCGIIRINQKVEQIQNDRITQKNANKFKYIDTI